MHRMRKYANCFGCNGVKEANNCWLKFTEDVSSFTHFLHTCVSIIINVEANDVRATDDI